MRIVISDSSTAPTILFGAFDRHNFGDLLFPHIVTALLATRNLEFAGVVERDLRPYGGHRVQALADLSVRWREQPIDIIHAGGELLTCDAWEAAVMTLPPDEAQRIIKYFKARPREGLEWAQERIGVAALAPYTVQRALFPQARTIVYNAVGGVDLDQRDHAFRQEVIANLSAADEVSVRDTATQAYLYAAGIRTRLMPDPAVMVATLFGDDIRRRSNEGEAAQMRRAFPQGYMAVQFSADFGDDATLSAMARQLDALVRATGFGIVFFRAGAAPWHDDMECFERIATRLQHPAVKIFTSLELWDICALIAASRAYLGSSLHGRIVAMAFALPRLNLAHSLYGSKQASFASTWEDMPAPHVVQVDGIAQGMLEVLAADVQSLQHKADELAKRYRDDFQALCHIHFSLKNI